MLYVLDAVGTNRTKIGITRDTKTLKRRLGNIKTGCPFPVKVIALFPNEGRKIENYLKHKYKNNRNPGTEWIIIPFNEILEEITLYLRNNGYGQ